MKTQKRSAFDALCEQHYELLNEHGPFGWGIIAVEAAQDEQNALLSQRDALLEALEQLISDLDEYVQHPAFDGASHPQTVDWSHARSLISQIKG